MTHAGHVVTTLTFSQEVANRRPGIKVEIALALTISKSPPIFFSLSSPLLHFSFLFSLSSFLLSLSLSISFFLQKISLSYSSSRSIFCFTLLNFLSFLTLTLFYSIYLLYVKLLMEISYLGAFHKLKHNQMIPPSYKNLA
jgi:hypothetical protein